MLASRFAAHGLRYDGQMETLPLFPLGTALFPDGVLSLRIFEVRYLHLMRQCIEQKQAFGIVPLLAGREVRTPENHEILASAGTLAMIDQHLQTAPGLMHIRCRGEQRIRLQEVGLGAYGLWSGRIERLEDVAAGRMPDAFGAMAEALGRVIASWQPQGARGEQMPVSAPYKLDELDWVVNRWAELLPFSAKEQETLLLTNAIEQRFAVVMQKLRDHGVVPPASAA